MEVLLRGQQSGGLTGRGSIFIQLLEVVRMELVLDIDPYVFNWREFPNRVAHSLNISASRVQIIDSRLANPEDTRRLRSLTGSR